MPYIDEKLLEDVHPTIWQKAWGAVKTAAPFAIPALGAAQALHTAEPGYEKVAKGAEAGLAKGLGAVEPQAFQDVVSPQTQASLAVPETLPQAAMTAASFVLPEAGIVRRLGEAASPAAKMLGTRLGRVAGLGAVGAATGAATGGVQGAISGAEQGLAAGIPGEATSAIGGALGRKAIGPSGLIDDTTKNLGDKIQEILPWLDKTHTAGELEDAFKRKGAVGIAGARLDDALNQIENHPAVQAARFRVPIMTPKGPRAIPVPFREAYNASKEMNNYAFAPGGGQRGGISAKAAQDLSHEINDQLEKQLNHVAPGLGKMFRQSRSEYGVAKTFGHVFEQPGVLEGGAMSQPKVIETLMEPKYRDELYRTIGKEKVDGMMDVLRRGYQGAASDIPGEAGHGRFHLSGGVLPTYTRSFGKAYDPVGKVPAYLRPGGKIADAAALSTERATGVTKQLEPWSDNPSPFSKEKDRLAAEQFVGTSNPERIDTVAKLQDKIRKGKAPDVASGLRTGRLSLPALKRMLQGTNEQNSQAMMQRLAPEDAAHLYTLADPAHKLWMAPHFEQKLQMLVQSGKITPQMAQQLMGEEDGQPS